jgi:cytochrome c-type biogenesis protein CcmH
MTAAIQPPIPLNKRLKRWPGWVLVAAVVVVALVIGATRSSGPLTDDDRVDSISERIACPICDGESVFESQNGTSLGIKAQIKSLVQQGQFSDDEIIDYLTAPGRLGPEARLTPDASGFDSLVWILPVFVGICAIAGLWVAFRRWKVAIDTIPTDDDRALVEAALRDET